MPRTTAYLVAGLAFSFAAYSIFFNHIPVSQNQMAAAAGAAAKKPYYPTAQGTKSNFAVVQNVSTTKGDGTITSPKLSDRQDISPTYIDSYIVELTQPALLDVAPGVSVAQQLTKIKNQQSSFLGALPAAVKSENGDVALNVSQGKKKFNTVLNAVVLDMSESEAAAVAKKAGVKKIERVQKIPVSLQQSLPLIRAPQVWNSSTTAATGAGVTIAIIDTGVDYRHKDLGDGCFGKACKVVGGWDFVNNDSDPMDDMGHGTHVASIAAGNGALKGVAPDAEILAYKVCDQYGNCYTDDIIAALEKSSDPNGDGNFDDHVDIVNLSLGGSGNPDDAMSQAVDNAAAAGVVPVIAAGNSGAYGVNTIGSPGTARRAITVAASDDVDNRAWFSSIGDVKWTDANGKTRYLMKPDVSAPGVYICAARWGVSFPDGDTYCNQDSTHVAISGTSMATPHVAGLAALLLQLHPTWTPDEIKATIKNTAHQLQFYRDQKYVGTGRIDALDAANYPRPAVASLDALGALQGNIAIRGTAGGSDFLNYKLEYKPEGADTEYIPFYTGTAPVINGDLYPGGIDSTTVADGMYMVRLTVTNTSGGVSTDIGRVEVNNYAITSVGNLGYVNASAQPISGISSGSIGQYKITLDSADGVVLCSGTSLPTNGVICTHNFKSVAAGAHQLYLSVLKQDLWQTDAPFKVAVIPSLMTGWPKSISGAQRGISMELATGPSGSKELIVPHFGLCNGGICYGSSLQIFNSAGMLRTLEVFSNGIYVPSGGQYASIPGTNKLAGDTYFQGQIFDVTGTHFASLVYTPWDMSGGWPVVFDSNGDGTSEVFIVSANTNTGQVHLNGFTPAGAALPGYPIDVPKGNLSNEFYITMASFVHDGHEQRPVVITGTYDFDVSSGDMLALQMYAHVFSPSGQLIKSTKIFDGTGRRLWLTSFATPVVADFGNDGKTEMAIAFMMVDAPLYRANQFDSNAYKTHVMLVDSAGGIKASADPIYGYSIESMSGGDAGTNGVADPNLLLALTETWGTLGQGGGGRVIRFDGALRPQFNTSISQILPNNETSVFVNAMTVGDVTGDGRSDLVMNYRTFDYTGKDSGLFVLNWQGALQKNIRIPTLGAAEDFWGNTPILGDFNGNGTIDAVLTSLHIPFGYSLFGTAYETLLLPIDFGVPLVSESISWKTRRGDDQSTGCVNCAIGRVISPLTAPTNLKATCNVAGDKVTLSWDATPGAEGYHVRVNDQTNDGPSCKDNWYCTNTTDVATWQREVTLTTQVKPGLEYQWWMLGTRGSESSPVAAMNFRCDPQTSVPAAPTNLRTSCDVANSKVTITWDATPSAAYYMLRMDDSSNNASSCQDGWYCPNTTDVRNENYTSTSFTTPVVLNRSYPYWMIAVNAVGASPVAGLTVSCGSDTPQTRDQKRMGDMEKLKSSLAQYFAAKGTYPKALTGTCSLHPSYHNLVSSLTPLVPIYLASVPIDPQPRACEYNYAYTATGENPQTYTITMNMETNDPSVYNDHWCIGATTDPTAHGLFQYYRMCGQ